LLHHRANLAHSSSKKLRQRAILAHSRSFLGRSRSKLLRFCSNLLRSPSKTVDYEVVKVLGLPLPLMPPPPPGWESRVKPFAGMRCPFGTFLRPKGAIAYQPGV
jgi:hypothetical protein